MTSTILNNLEEYNWEVNNFEDLTQSDCDHNCSTQTTVTSTSTANTATTLVPPIETTHPLTNPTFTKALNKLGPRPDCQIRIGNEALHMITSPGRNQILNTHTDADKTFGTDLSDKLFWTRKGHNLHSLTIQWGKIDQYCWRLQPYLRLINLGLAIETDQTNSTAFTTLLVNYQEFENDFIAFTTALKKDLLIDKNSLSAIIKSKGKRSRRRILEDEDEEVQKAIYKRPPRSP
jgi:hypothetical protein